MMDLARLEGTLATLEPLLPNGLSELERTLLVYIAIHHGVTRALDLLFSTQNPAHVVQAEELH
jgi:hypothetical protein